MKTIELIIYVVFIHFVFQITTIDLQFKKYIYIDTLAFNNNNSFNKISEYYKKFA